MKPFYRFSWGIVRTLFKVLFGFRAVGSEKVPVDGPVILASNHRSYYDPPLIGISINREVHFLAKVELFSFRPFGKLISALNAHPVRRGQKDIAAVAEMVDLLKNARAVVIFPEGTRQKGMGDHVKAKSGVARLALATGAPIMTTYVQGSENVWKALFRLRPVRVHFGRIIEPEEYRKYSKDSKGFRSLAKYVLGEINELGREVEG
jgi:1-acyl-sn-glycerol-3-phosphate acyltransferase